MGKFKVGDEIVLTRDYFGEKAGTTFDVVKGDKYSCILGTGFWIHEGLADVDVLNESFSDGYFKLVEEAKTTFGQKELLQKLIKALILNDQNTHNGHFQSCVQNMTFSEAKMLTEILEETKEEDGLYNLRIYKEQNGWSASIYFDKCGKDEVLCFGIENLIMEI